MDSSDLNTNGADTVVIQITGSGLSFQGKTDVFKAGQVIAFLHAPSGRSGPISPSSASLTTSPVLTSRGMISGKSPREFIVESGAKTNPQKILALAKYWMDLGGGTKETFSLSDIRPLFSKAGEPLPGNLSRDAQAAVRLSYIHDQGDEEYIITNTGLQALDESFQNESADRPKPARKQRSSEAKKSDIRENVKTMEITVTMSDFPSYWDLKTKNLRILWILEYAAQKGVDGLHRPEICFLASKVRDAIVQNNLSGLTETSVRKGYLVQQGDIMRITQPGVNFLKEAME